jgi:hypothetical protein
MILVMNDLIERIDGLKEEIDRLNRLESQGINSEERLAQIMPQVLQVLGRE